MDTLKNMLSPLAMNTGALQDTLASFPVPVFHGISWLNTLLPQKLVVIGGTVETARRASMSAWNGFVECESIAPMRTAPTQMRFSAFFLTAHFSQDDYPYDW